MLTLFLYVNSALSADGMDIRSFIQVIPERSTCTRSEENELLHNYLATKFPIAHQVDPTQYVMYAPPDPLGPSYGIYTTESNDPIAAKQTAMGHCMAGEATIVSDVLIVDENVAVTFNC